MINLECVNEESKVELVTNKSDKGNTKSESVSTLTFDNIGLSIRNLSNDEKESYKVENGVMITDVKTLSKAYDQALGPNLVITQVDRKKIDSVDEFDSMLKSKKGDAILLKVVDDQGRSRLVGLEIPE